MPTLLASASAHAATATWTGANGGNWTTGTNWSGGTGTGGIPGSADTAVVNSGASDGPIISSNAGTVTNTEIGIDATGGTFSIQAGGSLADTGGNLGVNAGSTGIATVSGAGAAWTNSSILFVGKGGTGTLTIGTGGAVSDVFGTIGDLAGSTGTATISGAGASWNNSSNFFVGENGQGSLTIGAGGTVSDVVGTIGDLAGSTGTATVSGAGATWTNSGNFVVGNVGTGTLTIGAGGAVSDVVGILSQNAGSTGTAMVSGAGATWTNSVFAVGDSGDGTLTIGTEGTVSAADGYLGVNAGSTGTATVSGAGAAWTNSSTLVVGDSGTGTLTVQNGGAVSAPVVSIASHVGSIGTLNIGAAPGSPATAPGAVNASTVAFGAGTGTINFNHTSSAYAFTPAITGSGTINFLAGNTLLAGDMSSFVGALNVTPGANITTSAQQQASIQNTVNHRQAAMIESRAVSNELLGMTRPVDNSNYAYAGAMFGSAEGMAGGQFSKNGFTLTGGFAYGETDYPGVSQSDSPTIAAALRYAFNDPFGDEAKALHPFIEAGGSVSPDETLRITRSYQANFGATLDSSGSTDATAWDEYGRAGMAWNIDSANQLTAYGEFGRQSLAYNGYTESSGPFLATFGSGVMKMDVARAGGSYTLNLQSVVQLPLSMTLAGAAAHAIDAKSGMAASIDGINLATGNSDPTWGEFGARFNIGLTEQLTASAGIDGTTGAANLGTTVHGDAGISYKF